MKATKLFFTFVAVAAMMFAACGKDDPEPTNTTTNNGGGNTPGNAEVTPNGLVIGTQAYQMHPSLSITNEGYYLFDANDPNGVYDIIADVPSTLLGKTLNLAQLADADRFYISFHSMGLSFALQTGNQPISVINDEPVAAVLTDGTLRFTKENGVVALSVSGTLSNGTFVGFIMNVPVTDIDAMDNQVIIDGVAYFAEPLVRHRSSANLSYDMMLSGQEEGSIGVNVEVEPTALNHNISLTTTTTAYKYRVKVYLWDQDTTATQDAFTGTVESSYWDIEAQTDYPIDGCLFTSGTLNAYEEDYAIGFTINGTMTNGRTISAQLRVSKQEIHEEY